jgi:type II secretory pathway pseudopilin PulG
MRHVLRKKLDSVTGTAGMTIMEMLVAMSILVIIVVGLLNMFSYTQKALRGSVTQTDVMETGRSIMDLMMREIPQAKAVNLPLNQVVYFYGFPISNSVNFYAITNTSNEKFPPLSQKLIGGVINYDIEDLFFTYNINRQWFGVGYFVNITNNSGVGTLYRYLCMTNHSGARELFKDFQNEKSLLQNNPQLKGTTKTHRVADGIVHFEIHCYDRNGMIYPDNISSNIIKLSNFALFMGNALPYSVEIVLGVLEPPVLEQISGMPGASVRAFLEDERRAGRVHIFRQTIPLHSASTQ